MSKVHIRKRPLAKGKQSLILDFSPPLRNPKTGKPQRFEFLELFIYEKPGNLFERRHNAETMELVENIRANRQLDIQNRKYGFISQRTRNSSFVDYFKEITDSKKETDSDNIAMAFRYFLAFSGHDVIFNDLDEFFCDDYKNFLLSGPGISRRGSSISRNTAVSYFAKFRNVLQRAYRQKLLTTDLFAVVTQHSSFLQNKLFELLFNLSDTNPDLLSSFMNFTTYKAIDLNKVVEGYYRENLTLEELAYKAGRSLATFKREFQKIYNTSPHRWLLNRRLEYARDLIEVEGMNVSDASLHASFASVAHFSRAFKRKYNVSPSSLKEPVAVLSPL